MNCHQGRLIPPLAMEPRRDTRSESESDHSQTFNHFLSSRQLPSIELLQQQDDYVQMKLSGLSISVSPNSIQKRAPPNNSLRSNQLLLKKAVMQQHEPYRRHSISNVYPMNEVKFHLAPSPAYSSHCQMQTSAGHCSAPSSPPLVAHCKSSRSYHYSPYTKKNAYTFKSMEENSISTRGSSHSYSPMHQQITYDSNISNRRKSFASTLHMTKANLTIEEEEEEDRYHKNSCNEMEGLYSRTPELRVSHKLAERKRRKEMKDLFDELRNALPVDKSIKTSKWEILSKAVEYISVLRNKDCHRESELLALRQELHSLKDKH